MIIDQKNSFQKVELTMHVNPDSDIHPLVSVVMPVYNRRDYLAEAIESILCQSLTDFELIIVDDCSTDGSIDVFMEFSKKDKRIKLIRNDKNLGVSQSRNLGAQVALGEFIAIMDSDDIAHSSRLEKQVNYLMKYPEVGFCGTWIEYFGETKRKIWKTPRTDDEIRCRMLFTMGIANPTVMFRRNVILTHTELFKPEFRIAEDYEMWTRALDITQTGNLAEVLLRYRTHPQQISKQSLLDLNFTRSFIHERYLKKLGLVYTEDELMLHGMLCDNVYRDWTILLNRADKWLRRLEQANNENNLFDQQVFQRELIERWTDIINKSRIGKVTLGLILFSPLQPGGANNLLRRVIFAIKWIIRKLIEVGFG